MKNWKVCFRYTSCLAYVAKYIISVFLPDIYFSRVILIFETQLEMENTTGTLIPCIIMIENHN